MAAHALPKRPRIRKTPLVPVSFCVSWSRVFLFLAFFYLGVAICIYWQVVGNVSLRGSAQAPTIRGGAMHEMLRSIRNNTKVKLVESIVGRAVERVEAELEVVEHKAEKYFPQLAIPPQHRVPAVNNIPVDEDYAERLKSLESNLNQDAVEPGLIYRSCRWREDQGFYSLDPSCHSGSGPITYFNPHKEARLLCEHEIAAGGKLELPQPCHEPSRLFRRIPDLTAKDLPVVTTGFSRAGPAEDFECDIPCRNRGTPGITCQRFVDGTDWVLEFSMEGPQYYPALEIRPLAYRDNQFYSTTSYQSEVPLPYYSWAEYNIHVPGLNYDDAIKAAVFLARNCNSRNHREDVIRKLQQSSFRVDSLSACLHNAEPPPGVSLGNKKDVMGHYLFYLAFENQNVPDYITEKLWGPFEAGTVPVYFGAPNIKEHVPNNSIIAVSDFATIDDLADHLNKVANDKELYQSYQAWRYQPLPPHFHAKYDFTHIHSTCRTCRWAHARLYGLGWNHYNQSLQELKVPRTLCVNNQGLAVKPFAERWLSGDGEHVDSPASRTMMASCQVGEDRGTLPIRSNLKRTLREKDGVIDLEITGDLLQTEKYELLVDVPLHTPNVQLVSTGHLRLQSNETRFTVLTWPRVVESTHFKEHLQIPVHAHILPLQIRIIVEDVDIIHKEADEVENYFGNRMIQDFYNPVEAFMVVQNHEPK